MKLATRVFALLAHPISAVTISGIPVQHPINVRSHGNMSFSSTLRGNHSNNPFEEMLPYNGDGCEDYCSTDSTDDCEIAPCKECKHCHYAPVAILEVGTVNVGGWKRTGAQTFSFSKPFGEVPVVVVLPTARGGHPATIRINHTTVNGFEAVITEAPGKDGPHVAMNVAFLAAAPGSHELPGGLMVQAKRIQTKKSVMGWRCKSDQEKIPLQDWETVKFEKPFSSEPSVLATIQTMVNEKNNVPKEVSKPFLSVAVKDLILDSVSVSLERAETGNQGIVAEDEVIGIVAIQAGSGQFALPTGDVFYTSSVSPRMVRGWQNGKGQWVNFDNPPTGLSEPVVLAGMCTRNGGDGGWLRIRKATAGRIRVTVDEDVHCDKERKHTTEKVCISAFSRPFVYVSKPEEVHEFELA